MPPRKKIFGDFLYQGTNTLFFSHTNYGKSILAFQIAVNAATGNSFEAAQCFKNECGPMKVLYFDFEMDDQRLFQRHKQIFSYYSKKVLTQNLIIAHVDTTKHAIFGSKLLAKIEGEIDKHKPELIILDNLTKILPDSLNPTEVNKIIDSMSRIT